MLMWDLFRKIRFYCALAATTIDARVGGGMALVADLYYALHEPQMMQIYPFVYVSE